ncbi:MAG: glycosyltransferase involved in cell wall biosynthesis [Planctomycetota bacterium]|jgi:glycosyltransferase involved in cell wall biosynthesis
MKILTVVHDYLPLHVGGAELNAHQTSAILVERGHDVTALFTERDLSQPAGTIKRGELDGVKTIEVIHQREYADVRETYQEEESAGIFKQMIEELRPDVVHFHNFAFWGARCVGIARAAGCRVVAVLHDYHLICDNSILLRKDASLCTEGSRGGCHECLERHPLHPDRASNQSRGSAYRDANAERRALHAESLAQVHKVVPSSYFLADRFKEAGWLREEQIVVLKAGYPGARREARRSDPTKALRVGFVGGIYHSKGVHVLVEAFSHLKDVAAELSVHGVLEWFPDYVASLREIAVDSAVRFAGRFDPAELDSVLAGFDVLVVPSIWYENMPLTIQQAFRNSIPVIATDLGGMAESVEDGVSGKLFPRGDSLALAGVIRELANDREELFRLASQTPIPPSMEDIALEVEALYRAE